MITMLKLFDIFTFFITSCITIKSIRSVLNGNVRILLLCEIVTYVVHVIPLIVGLFFDYTEVYSISMSKVIAAINDISVGYIYDVIIILICWILYIGGRKQRKIDNERRVSTNFNSLINICYFGMISPLIGVLLSPKPSIYKVYSYFYTVDLSHVGIEYEYHIGVLSYLFFISLVSTIGFYYLAYNKKNTNIIVFLSSILTIWCQGKRAFLVLFILGILIVDIIKIEKNTKNVKIIRKTIIFVVIVILYFIVYKKVTGKAANTTNENQLLITYELYFSRMSAFKTVIYAAINDEKILAYPGQSYLFDFFAFIPRSFWPDKPILFTRYYTAYAHGRSYGTLWSGGNLLTNIWVEVIANFGLFGVLGGLAFLLYIANKSEKLCNEYIKIIGLVFCTFYCTNAFSNTVMYLFYIWILMLFFDRIKKSN